MARNGHPVETPILGQSEALPSMRLVGSTNSGRIMANVIVIMFIAIGYSPNCH